MKEIFSVILWRKIPHPPLFQRGGDTSFLHSPPFSKGETIYSPPLKKGGRGDFFATILIAGLFFFFSGNFSLAADTGTSPSFVSMAGENCKFSVRLEIPQDPVSPDPVSITCGGLTHPSGNLALLPLPRALSNIAVMRHKMLEQLMASSSSGQSVLQRMTCQVGSWRRLKWGQDVFIRSCSLIDGDWPNIVVATVIGKYILFADGLPVLLPIFASVGEHIAKQVDEAHETVQMSAGFSDMNTAQSLLDRVYGGKIPMIGSAEIDKFKNSIEEARLQEVRTDYRAAEIALRQALSIQEKAMGTEALGIGSTLMELALVVSNQGRTEEASSLLRRSEPIIQRSHDPAILPRYNQYLAYNAANGGKFEDALTFARGASGMWRDLVGTRENSSGSSAGKDQFHTRMNGELAHCLGMVAAMGMRTGNLAEAEAAAREALEILGDESGLPAWWRPELLITLGKVYAAMKRMNEAEISFKGALVYQLRLFGETAPTAMTLLSLASVYSNEGLDEDAMRAYEFAIKILKDDDLARSHLTYDQLAPLIDSAASISDSDERRSKEMNEIVFRALQLLNSGVADQTIAKASLRMVADDPEVARLMHEAQEAERKRDAARIELAHETSKPDEERGSRREKALLAEINDNETLRVNLSNLINSKFPAYAEMSQPRLYRLDELQKFLGHGEACVLIEVGRSLSHAIVITRNKLVVRSLLIDQQKLASAVVDLRSAVVPKANGRLAEFDMEDSYSLYKKLFLPIERDLDGIDHFTLIPTGALASLPISVILTKKPDKTTTYRNASWLVNHYSTAVVPSIVAFMNLHSRPKVTKFNNVFIGIGDPAFSGNKGNEKNNPIIDLAKQCRESGPIPPQFLRSLAPLPDTTVELRSIVASLGVSETSLLLGKRATEEAFRQMPLSDTKILYFATHGLLPGELSCQTEPALALSPPPETVQDRNKDGLLEASEIATLQLKAELVVLSACNTAQNPSQLGGEALAGLADSFFYAGARSVLASHWEVPSAATSKLMSGMFSSLAANPRLTIVDALRRSQRDLINRDETSHPFFWAAFTLLGDIGGGETVDNRSTDRESPSVDSNQKGNKHGHVTKKE